MKHLILTILFSTAFLSVNAQKNAHVVVQVEHPELLDSLNQLNAAIEKVEGELKGRSTYTVVERNGENYNMRDHTTDSLTRVKWKLITHRNALVSQLDNQKRLDVHLMKAGENIQRANTLGLVGSAIGIAGGTCLGVGIAQEKTPLTIVGIAACAVSLGCAVGSIVCSYKSGHELKLAAGSITYTF